MFDSFGTVRQPVETKRQKRQWQEIRIALGTARQGTIYDVLKVVYPKLFVEKKQGEVKISLLMLFFMFAAAVAVCWGIFGQPKIAAVSVFMWGTGDAAAALVGILFGKHKVGFRLADGKKSREGSFSMLLVSALCGLGMLLFAQKMPLPKALPAAVTGAVFGTAAELFTPGEYDTVTVPAVIAAVLLFFV